MSAASRRPTDGVDERAAALAALERACTSGSVELLSLDVFDTVILRRVARPVDAFFVLGSRLREQGTLPGAATAGSFARMRRVAEDSARTRAASDGRSVEIALADVYAEFTELSDTERAHLVDEELRVEGALCFVDPDVVALTRAAADAGVAIALVSDTYFSAAHLDYLLGGRIDVAAHAVFASSDHGVGKGSGLFDIVLDALDVEAARTVHVGDNEYADVAAAEHHGIRAFHLPRVPDVLRALMESEGLALPAPEHPAVVPPVIDAARGDHGLSALRVRAASHARSVADDELLPYRELGATVLGPVFVGFAEWVAREAAALGARRVYCLMREGALLAPLIRDVAATIGVDLDARPLWISRQVAAVAALGEIDEPSVRALLVRQRTPTARDLAATLGVPVRAIASRGTADIPLDDVLLANRVVARIVHDDRLRRRIAAEAAEKRRRLGAYLSGVVDPGDEEIVIVDLGWNATIQRGLDQALARMGDPRSTHGRYLATTREVSAHALDGLRARGFLVDQGVPDGAAAALVRNPEVLELVTLPTEGSVVGYSDSGEPVVETRPVPSEQLAQEDAVRAGIDAFRVELARAHAWHPRLGLADAAPALRAVLRRFLARPTAAEFARFAGWAHEDNFGSDAVTTLGTVDDALDVSYLSAVDLYRLPQRWWWWPAGFVASVDAELAAAADRVLDGATPESVGARRIRDARVTIDVESDVAAAECVAADAVTVNRNGRATVHLASVVPRPSVIRCRVLVDGAVVDRIRTVFAVRGAADTVVDVRLPDDAWRVDPTRERELCFASDRFPAADVYRTDVVLYLQVPGGGA